MTCKTEKRHDRNHAVSRKQYTVLLGRPSPRLPFITSKYFYEHGDAFDVDEKKLMAQGVAAFGGIAPTYRIALLDKPTIVWDFHSLLIGLQMMFSFMLAEEKTPLRMCDHCDTIFVQPCHNASSPGK